jgi:hypothetical protein
MSTLSVTSVTTGNSTTDFTLSTGNTNAADLVIFSNGYGIMLSGNSTSNSVYLVSNGNVGIGSSTPASKLYVKRGIVSFEPANLEYYAASVYAAQNSTARYGLQVRTNWQAVENKIVSFGVVDAVTGTDGERFAVNGVGAVSIWSNTLTLGTSSIAANGYSRLPNGLLMQWGTVTATVNGSTTNATSFSTTFASVYSINLTLQNASVALATNPGLAATITASNTSTFTWRTSSTAAAGSATIFWQAIGA